jgi:outer membrane receptor protein involved in Fe transport
MNPTKYITFLIFLIAFSLNASADSRLDEIVVTAQKKAEGLAEVPISIQVLSGDRISDLGITSVESLANHVPGLHVTKGAGEWNIYMRGVGSGANKGFSQSVTQFIDGMPISKGQQYLAPLLDIERIEVLKGTQGVLFGKNTIGGVINVISKSPQIGGEADSNMSVEFVPEWNTTKFQGATNISMSDSFAMRLAASYEESDGWIENQLLNTDEPSTEATSVRATFLWELDNTEVNLKLTSSSSDKSGQESGISVYRTSRPLPVLAQNGYTGAFLAVSITNKHFPNIVTGKPGVSYVNNGQGVNPTGGSTDTDNAILNITSSWGDHEFKSTTSYSSYDYTWGLDADFGPMDFLSTDSFHDFSAVTQEFVITSPSSDTFEYVAGLYYDDIDYFSQNNGTFATDFGGLFGQTFPAPDLFAFQTRGAFSAKTAATHTLFDQNSTTLSAFAEGTWYLNEKLTMKAGVRVSEDDKEVKGSQVFSSSATGGVGIDNPTMAPPVLGVIKVLLDRSPYNFPLQERSESHTTPSIKFLYEASDTTRLYFSAADGYKAGGFDGSENAAKINPSTPAAAFQFEPEEATTIEVGAKIEIPEKSLRANIAYFTTDYKDLQVSAWNGSAFIVSNAAQAEIDGVEIDVTWAPTDNLVLGGSITSLDFAYKSFTGAACTADQEVDNRLATGSRACTQDLSGQTGNYAPELSASIYMDYFQALSNNREMVISLNANHVDEFYSNGDNDPLGLHDSATKIGARIALTMANGLELALFGRNITDEQVGTQSIDLPLVTGSHFMMWEPGKEIGVSFRANF